MSINTAEWRAQELTRQRSLREQDAFAKHQARVERARVRAASPAKPVAAPPPARVTVAFTGADADALLRLADARCENPAVLAKAIVARALTDGTAEEGLGPNRAEQVADGHGRRPIDGVGSMTLRQCAVIYLVGTHGGATGWCGWSATALAGLMPDTITQGNVTDSLAWLVRRRLVRRGQKVSTMPAPHQLTELGRAVFAEIAGDFGG